MANENKGSFQPIDPTPKTMEAPSTGAPTAQEQLFGDVKFQSEVEQKPERSELGRVKHSHSVRAARPVAGVAQRVIDPDKPSGRLTRDGKMMPHQAQMHISELGSGYSGRIDPSTAEPEVHYRETDRRQGITFAENPGDDE